MMFAMATPVVAMALGAAIDYSRAASARSDLQTLADSAALAGAKELRLAAADKEIAIAVARQMATANAQDGTSFDFSATVGADRQTMQVTLTASIETVFLGFAAIPTIEVVTQAEARVFGGAPTCLMGLDPSQSSTIAVDKAKVTAPGCAIYANSTHTKALVIGGKGIAKAAFFCSGGGAKIDGTAQPAPRLDCPLSQDPLGDRPPPTFGGCNHVNYKAKGIAVLTPGVYCGGLEITAATIATLTPGVYVIKDGPLKVKNGSDITGLNAGFYLTGEGAVIDIDKKTIVSLSAPKSGPLAGMLFFEDRSNPQGKHKINSRNAPVLLGTFYLSQGELEIGAAGGLAYLTDTIGFLSAWTIVIARKVSVNDGINLTLNTDYSASSVPVPEGLGAESSVITLTH
jgi:Flp pilus assembly protein TadG